MEKRLLLISIILLFSIAVLSGCKIKMDEIVIDCNLKGKCEIEEGKKGDNESPSSNSESPSSNSESPSSNNEEPSSSGNGGNNDNNNANLLVHTALKYSGYTRENFKPVAKKHGFTIGDNTSWCAIFVSSMIKEASISDMKKYSSASVSTFMKGMVNDKRFYHSKYWYKESKKFEDPLGGPQVGDIVFFVQKSCALEQYKGDGNLPKKSDGCYRHIGIVLKVTSSKITYIHGNTSKCNSFKGNGVCANTTEDIGSAYIIGYGR